MPKRQDVQTRQLAAHLAAQEAGWPGAHPPALVHHPRRQVTRLLDELTAYRRPTLARAYAPMGRDALTGHTDQPLAERSHRSSTATRVAATLGVISGQVLWRQGSRMGLRELVGLYQDVRAASPDAERIWVVQDNWPLHWHADLLGALQPQQTRCPPTGPPVGRRSPACRSSVQAQRQWGDLRLPIQVVFLPTSASWLHPIETLWRWLRQDVLHRHRLGADLPALRAPVAAFLSRFTRGTPDAAALLRYVGLLPI